MLRLRSIRALAAHPAVAVALLAALSIASTEDLRPPAREPWLGTVVRSENGPARIEGGEAHRVVKGDIIIIPAGSAHMYSQVDEPITYLEWRWVAPQ